MTETFELLATCAFGLEAVVARELDALGYHAKPIGTGRVLFSGDDRAIVDANLWLRSADRVLVRLATLAVGAGDPGFDALFEGTKAIEWERWIAPGAAFPVAGRAVRSAINSEPALQRTVKRAIVDRLRKAHAVSGVLPEHGPPVAIEVSLLNDVATLTIDTSGVGLHKRGYREGAFGEAALKETLAAGLVLLSVWRPGRPLVDPFCGSGTIAIEAAMLARNIAPGLHRGFDAERWTATRSRGVDGMLIDPKTWADARADARDALDPKRLRPVIHASDISDTALKLARQNARDAGVDADIHFVKRDFADLASTADFGVIITNPPYGVRIGEEHEVERLYRLMPLVLRKLPTWSFHILTARLDLELLLGQPSTRRRKIYNSRIECAYFSFLGPKRPAPSSGAHDRTEDHAAEPAHADPVDGDPIDADPLEADALGTDVSAVPDARAVLPPTTDDDVGTDNPAFHPAPPMVRPERTTAEPRTPPRPVAPVFGGLRERDLREAGDFGRCLANTLRHLRKYPSRGVTCYRVYERDVPDVPLIVDRYEDRYHAAEHEREHSRTVAQQADWFDLMRRTIAQTAGVPVEHVFMKEKHRQRGLSQHERLSTSSETRIVHEGGLGFEINLTDYIDTGLFLDHRLTRQMVRDQSAGKRLLNLFCYTGSFTVYAAAGGAAATTSVDLSNTYLDWAKRNLTINRLQDGPHELIKSDVLAFLGAQRRGPGGNYDLAVIDPPTFSNSTSTDQDWDVQYRHVELLSLVAPLMSPGGVVYFSTNFRRFKLDHPGVTAAGFEIRDLSARTVPPEYRNRRIHQCWRLTVPGKPG